MNQILFVLIVILIAIPIQGFCFAYFIKKLLK